MWTSGMWSTIADQRSVICGCNRHAVAITRQGWMAGIVSSNAKAEEYASVRVHLSARGGWCSKASWRETLAESSWRGDEMSGAMLDRCSLQSLVATFAIDPQTAQ